VTETTPFKSYLFISINLVYMSLHIKSSTIRRLTRLVKSLYPTMRRIPNPLPRPNTDAFRAGKTVDNKAAQERQAEFERADSRRLDKSTIRFFCEVMGNEGRDKR
jgi:hypothetical protein